MNARISVIILTYNEDKHIKRCIEGLQLLPADVYIVDSGSSDSTRQIATSMGADVYTNQWINYATQFNWALDNIFLKTEWVMRLDADEVVTLELAAFIRDLLENPQSESHGIYVRRQMYFMNKWIRHGGMYPIHVLRIFRVGMGRCEQRWMDEHIKLKNCAKTISIKADIIDNNLNNLGWWTQKHNGYATREAIDLLNTRFSLSGFDEVQPAVMGTQEQRKRWLKIKYSKLPLFIRPFFYFIYRYFFLFGFIDGIEGLVWHCLQGFWYRFLVDAKLLEIKLNCGDDQMKIKLFLNKQYGIHFTHTKEGFHLEDTSI